MNGDVVTPYGRNAGSSRVRVHSWLDRVEDKPSVHSYLSANRSSPWVLARRPAAVLSAELELRRLAARRPSWLMLHREASPLSRGALEASLIAASGFSVYDFDDALHLDRGQGSWWRGLAPKAPKVEAAVTCADRVVAGNELLADWASSLARDVVVVPSCVDVPRYEQKLDYALSDPPRLVWIGSRDNEPVLELIAPALRALHAKTGARLLLIGSPAGSLPGLEELVDRLPWSESVQHRELARADAGLMPLADDEYSRGKCGYKLLQYAAAGLPAVGSAVGTNEVILKRLGLPAAAGVAEWYDQLLDLLSASAATRQRTGQEARLAAEQHYSFDAWDARWRAAVGLPTVTRRRGVGT